MKPGASGLGRAAAIVSLGVLLSRILGVVREQVIAALLGVSADTDLYVLAFAIPDYLFFLLAGGFLAITLVPLLSEYHASGDREELNRSFTAVFRVVAIGSVAFLALGFLFAQPLVELLFPSLDGATVNRLVPLTRIAIGLQVFFTLGALFAAAQYAEKRFLIPSLGPLVYNVGIIVGGLVGASMGDPDPAAFLIGGLVGAGIGSFGLQWFGAHRLGIRLVAGVELRHPSVLKYLALAIPLMIGQSVVALDEQWPKIFGQMVGETAPGGLNFARRLNMLPVGVIAQAAGVASFPFMARLFAAGRKDEMDRTVLVSTRLALATGVLATAILIPIVTPVVRTVFQYGAFSDTDTEVVAGYLLLFALSIPFWATHQVITRAFYAQKRMWVPVAVGTAATVVTVPLLFALTDRYGANGVAAGSSIGVALYAVAITATWLREATDGSAPGFLAYTAKLIVSGAMVAGAGVLLVRFGLDGLPQPIVGLVGAVVGTTIFLIVARFLGVEEVDLVVDRVRQRLKKR